MSTVANGRPSEPEDATPPSNAPSGNVHIPSVPVPFWITLGGLSDGAFMLYLTLAAHAKDGLEWPSRERLAGLIRKTVRSVSSHLAELERFGAIEVIHSRHLGGRNAYVVHTEPPEGFQGPCSLSEFDAKSTPVKPANKRPKISAGRQRKVWDRDGWQCVHCGDHRGLTVDHILAIVNGGTNAFDNLQTLCGPCNSSKRDREQVGPNRPKAAGK